MRALVQRVSSAGVRVEGDEERTIGPGLMILLGVREGDTIDLCPKLADKCANLRIFADAEGKMNRSAVDEGYEALVVSQFTLFADTRKGKRPSFTGAARPELGEECYDEFVRLMGEQGLKSVQTGVFGASMAVSLVNDGPVTILLDTDEWTK